ncbi:MAG: glycosyltransferase family 39 protein, partial [Planctomycetota bacterium]|nr:glycosyltransferase family 39 protein [Planctomycetota bacterium]
MVERRFLLSILALIVVGAVVLFFELGGHRTFGSHEVYAAVPAREMISSGDWIVPRYGEVPRLRKPPLGYWAVAASASLFGGLNETTARLPAAICGGLLAVLMGVWAGRWYGRSAGLSAALVQLTSVYVLIFARKSEVDMLLCLLTTTSMFLIAGDPRLGLVPGSSRGIKTRDSVLSVVFNRRWMLIFGLLGITCLAKFHFGLVMVGMPVVVFCLIHRRWNMLPAVINPVGWVLVALGVGLWPYLVLQVLPDAWSVSRTETIGRVDEL